MNLDTIGCVWTGEFDLNTLRVDGGIFESGKKKLRIKKYADTCGPGLILQICTGSISCDKLFFLFFFPIVRTVHAGFWRTS